MEESQEQKSFQPTHRKKEKAREKGKVAKSHELTSALVILAGLVAVRLLFPWFVSHVSSIAKHHFTTYVAIEGAHEVEALALSTILEFFKMLAPFLVIMIGVALAANYAQVGFLYSTTPLTPSLGKINPISGLKRLVSWRSVVAAAINIAKAAIVGLIFYYSIKGSISRYCELGDSDMAVIVTFIVTEAFSISIKAALVLLGLGFADYLYQYRSHIKSLMMTRHELKEEYKEIEGSPIIKSRIRAAQKALARQRMMKEVPKADVVITNPVHIAVALRYDPETMGAPTVVAKGKRLIAEKIKEIAIKHGVPIFENKPLAKSLYELVEVGEEIPAKLYRAVAEVLSYVYRLKGKVPQIVAQ